MKLLVMGATSGIGAGVVTEALDRGLAVRGMSRSIANDAYASPLFEACPGDATKADDIARAVDGVDAVIYALGIKESVAMLWQEVTLFSDTTRVLLPAMDAAGVSRLLVVTGFGAGRSRAAMSLPERLGHRALLGKPYEDKDRQEEMIAESSLEWTIVRPVILTKGAATGRYRVLTAPESWRNGLISRADVAHYLVDAALNGKDIRADVVLAR